MPENKARLHVYKDQLGADANSYLTRKETLIKPLFRYYWRNSVLMNFQVIDTGSFAYFEDSSYYLSVAFDITMLQHAMF